MTRIFQDIPLSINSTIELNEAATRHVGQVLRAKLNEPLTIFNGKGGEFAGVISAIQKKSIQVTLHTHVAIERESSLDLHLAQGISRGEKMDYTIQKAVELGVKKIIPLFTERCTVKLDAERRQKRLQHWQGIIISACEQCGRNQIPEIAAPDTLAHHIKNTDAEWRFILSPHCKETLPPTQPKPTDRIILLIGPEGGFSDDEMRLAEQFHFKPLNLGPRVLRTETAAVAGIVTIQCRME